MTRELSRPYENNPSPLLVKRMHYVSFVGLLRSDLFEGLCVGHAPKRCRICRKWFLTVNARHTKYCGKLKGRECRELAADHPLKQIYARRMNSIRWAVRRGSLDAEFAETMKRLAKVKCTERFPTKPTPRIIMLQRWNRMR